MNILTKISVVILVVLVVFFSAVVIQMATETPNYRFAYETQKAKNELLSQDSRQGQVLQRRLETLVDAANKRASDAEDKLSTDTITLTQKMEEEKARSAALEAKLTDVGQTLKKLEQDMSSKEARNVELVKAVNDARDEVNKKTDDIRRLKDQFDRKTLDAEGYQHQAEFYHEQLVQAEENLRKAEEELKSRGGSIAAKTGTTTVEPMGDIKGSLTAVDGAKGIASIDVGSAKGVQKGMAATVSRGSLYVCVVQIENVDTNSAAGVIVQKKLDPMQGDKFVISSQR